MAACSLQSSQLRYARQGAVYHVPQPLGRGAVKGQKPEGQLYVLGATAAEHDRRCDTAGSFAETRARAEELKRAGELVTLVHPFLDDDVEGFARLVDEWAPSGADGFFLFYPEEARLRPSVAVLRELLRERPSLRLGTQQDLSVVLGLALGRALTPPHRAVIEIFNDCNLRCDFCWTHSPLLPEKHGDDWLGRRMETALVFRYVDELAQFDVDLVELCAVGDPLFHPGVWEIIDYIKSRGLRLRISTNGTMITPKKAERFLEIGVDELFMNVSSGDRDSYAQIHNCAPTIYDNLESHLLYLADARDAHRTRLPYMRIINVITERNVGTIDKMIDFAVSIRAQYVDFRRVWAHQTFLRQLVISREKIEQLLARAEELAARLGGIKSNFDEFAADLRGSLASEAAPVSSDGLVPLRRDPTSAPANRTAPPCAVSHHFTLLDINQNLRFCCRGDKAATAYSSITEQWRGDEYQSFRSHWRERFRESKPLCEGCPHVEENVLFGEQLTRLGLRDLI